MKNARKQYVNLVVQDLIRVLVPPMNVNSIIINLNYYLDKTKLEEKEKEEIRKSFKKIVKIQTMSNKKIRLVKNELYLKFCGEPYILDDIK